MDRQRIYDAMLIKAFRKDVTAGMLNYWLRPYNIQTPDPDLKRQPPPVNIRIQSFVGTYLKPLADRLWDTERDQDIKTLDWMASLNCESTNRQHAKDLAKLRKEKAAHIALSSVVKGRLARQCATHTWGVTKPARKLRRIK